MKKTFLFAFISFVTMVSSYADRIYIMNSPGYNTAGAELIAAIIANGHTVTENNTSFILPGGFTSTCNDPINGYDWLCFFGDNDFTAMIPQIQTFIDAGGKVFYQYEVSCCMTSSSSAAIVASGVTGLPITPNVNDYIALDGSAAGGWEATNLSCCAPPFVGNAYKGMDGLPAANQLNATANLNGSTPLISLCTNFGFYFTTTDFLGAANQGGMVGVGDINFWYDGSEPWSNGGTDPVNPALVDYFFPGVGNTCYLFPPGCMTSFNNSAALNINLGNDTALCPGATLNLDATTAGATYVWQDASTNPTFNVTLAGTYYVQVTNSCGVAHDTIVVTYGNLPIVNLGADTILCSAGSLLLDATNVGATYLWQDNSVNPTFNVTSAGTYWVEVTINGCSNADSIAVGFGSSANLDLGNDTALCVGDNLVLNATTPGSTYQWQDNSNNPTFNATTTGTFYVTVTNSCAILTDTIHIIFIPIPAVNLGNDTILCVGDILILDATIMGATYQWQNNSTNPTFTVNQAGTYAVIVSVNGCSNNGSIDVLYKNIPTPILGPDTTICEGTTLMLQASEPGATYIWQDNSTNATFNVNSLGTYWVRISNVCGAITDSIQINYRNCDCDLYIPSAFSPNVDELNQYFYPATSCSLINYRFAIFDRWGREIFVTEDPSVKWDGFLNEKQVPIGIYVYRLDYEFDIPHVLPQTRIGHVSLLR